MIKKQGEHFSANLIARHCRRYLKSKEDKHAKRTNQGGKNQYNTHKLDGPTRRNTVAPVKKKEAEPRIKLQLAEKQKSAIVAPAVRFSEKPVDKSEGLNPQRTMLSTSFIAEDMMTEDQESIKESGASRTSRQTSKQSKS